VLDVRHEFGFHMTPKQAVEKLGIIAKRSIIKELKHLLKRKSWHHVKVSDLSLEERRKIILSKLFVIEKFTASGAFEKMKLRLVAGGHREDPSL